MLPDGTGRVNQAGLDFYSRVVDECLEAGVEPWITLYHWDLPEALQQRGGWMHRDVEIPMDASIALRFSEDHT